MLILFRFIITMILSIICRVLQRAGREQADLVRRQVMNVSLIADTKRACIMQVSFQTLHLWFRRYQSRILWTHLIQSLQALNGLRCMNIIIITSTFHLRISQVIYLITSKRDHLPGQFRMCHLQSQPSLPLHRLLKAKSQLICL